MTNAERLRSLAEELAIKEYGGCYPANIKQRLLCDAIEAALIATRREALEDVAVYLRSSAEGFDHNSKNSPWSKLLRKEADFIRSLIVPKGDV